MPSVKGPLEKTKHAKVLPKLAKLYNQYPRLTYNQIAAEANLPVEVVSSLLKRMIKQGHLEARKGFGAYELSQDQIARLREIGYMRKEGKTWREIGAHYGFTYQAVQQFFTSHLPELAEPLDKGWIDRLAELYNGGMTSQVDLARELKKGPATIQRNLKKLFAEGTLQRKRFRKQSTVERVKKIHALRQQGLSWHQVAEAFGLEPKNYTTLHELYRRYHDVLDT